MSVLAGVLLGGSWLFCLWLGHRLGRDQGWHEEHLTYHHPDDA